MRIREVDERDSSWEDRSPRFRAFFFSGGDEAGRSWAVETYDIWQADLLEVVDWASEHAGTKSLFAVALVFQTIESEHPAVSRRGLVWLLGLEANGAPLDELDDHALRKMHARRAARRSQLH